MRDNTGKFIKTSDAEEEAILACEKYKNSKGVSV